LSLNLSMQINNIHHTCISICLSYNLYNLFFSFFLYIYYVFRYMFLWYYMLKEIYYIELFPFILSATRWYKMEKRRWIFILLSCSLLLANWHHLYKLISMYIELIILLYYNYIQQFIIIILTRIYYIEMFVLFSMTNYNICLTVAYVESKLWSKYSDSEYMCICIVYSPSFLIDKLRELSLSCFVFVTFMYKNCTVVV